MATKVAPLLQGGSVAARVSSNNALNVHSGGLNCVCVCVCARSIDGDPTLVPSRPSVGNNAFGVTLCIVASWLLCRPAEAAAGKNRIQLFGALSQNSAGTCSRIVPRSTITLCLRTRWLHCIHVCVRSAESRCYGLRASRELRLLTFVARTDFLQSPRVVRTSAGDKLLVIAATACCGRPRYSYFGGSFVRKLR